MAYLVTGGAGFIGSNIVEHLLRRGEKVRVLDNFSTGRRENLSFDVRNAVEVIEGDIRDVGTCRKAVRGMDTSSIKRPWHPCRDPSTTPCWRTTSTPQAH